MLHFMMLIPRLLSLLCYLLLLRQVQALHQLLLLLQQCKATIFLFNKGLLSYSCLPKLCMLQIKCLLRIKLFILINTLNAACNIKNCWCFIGLIKRCCQCKYITILNYFSRPPILFSFVTYFI